MECKHELKDLVGMADGIHCKACGAILDKLPEKQEGRTDGKQLDDNKSSRSVEKRKRARRPESDSSVD